jgi:radical SAM superfamily enzyme
MKNGEEEEEEEERRSEIANTSTTSRRACACCLSNGSSMSSEKEKITRADQICTEREKMKKKKTRAKCITADCASSSILENVMQPLVLASI